MPLLTTGAGKYEAGAPAVYNPATDPGLKFWLKADDGPYTMPNPSSVNGQYVDAWQDRGPLAAHTTTTGGSGLNTYYTNVQNGLPGVTSTASRGLITANSAVTNTSAVFSIVVLMRLTGGSAGGRVLSILGNGKEGTADYDAANSLAMVCDGGATPVIVNFALYPAVHGNGGAAMSFPVDTVKSHALILDGSQAHVYLSGIEQGSATSWSAVLGNPDMDRVTVFSIFAGTDGGGLTLFELIMTTTDLRSQLATGVANYFTGKWGAY